MNRPSRSKKRVNYAELNDSGTGDAESGPDSDHQEPTKKKKAKSAHQKKAATMKTGFDAMKIPQLKQLCRDKGLPVSGKKAELIARLSDPNAAAKQLASKKRLTVSDVDAILTALGENSGSVSNCLKRAIQRGFVRLDGDNPLDKVICSGTCIHNCDDTIDVTVRDVLYQPDYAGCDYEEGGQDASVQCPGEECGGIYVQMCDGKFGFDCGKFFNHCTQCKGFGECIGDYRMAHCEQCGKHYFAGMSGFACDNCGNGDSEDDDGGFGFW